jgi:hypothetical protein
MVIFMSMTGSPARVAAVASIATRALPRRGLAVVKRALRAMHAKPVARFRVSRANSRVRMNRFRPRRHTPRDKKRAADNAACFSLSQSMGIITDRLIWPTA